LGAEIGAGMGTFHCPSLCSTPVKWIPQCRLMSGRGLSQSAPATSAPPSCATCHRARTALFRPAHASPNDSLRRVRKARVPAQGRGPALCARRPDITTAMVHAFLTKMYRANADFVFTVTRDFVRACQTPILVLPDDVPAHPYAVAMESARLAPNAEVSIYPWKESVERAREQVSQCSRSRRRQCRLLARSRSIGTIRSDRPRLSPRCWKR
jgi:hypothetical protein